MAFNTTEPTIGLKLSSDNSSYKMYMADTGLLISHSFDERGIVSNEIYKNILFDKLEFNSGMITQNILAQMLTSANHRLYFFSKYSKENNKDRMKIDFVITKENIGRRHNICAIEVKSTKNYTTSSLNKFKVKYKEQLGNLYIIHSGNYKEENGIIYLPLYMTPLL